MLIANDNLLTSRLGKYCYTDEIERYCIELNLKKKIETCNFKMKSVCTINNLKFSIKEPACYKNPGNPCSIDLSLTNCPKNFEKS